MPKRKQFEYEIQYTKAADKFLGQHEDVRLHYENAVRRILTDDHPESVDVRCIKGRHSTYYRIRIGSYRVIYTVIDGKIIVIMTVLAGPRGDVYKKMDGLR